MSSQATLSFSLRLLSLIIGLLFRFSKLISFLWFILFVNFLFYFVLCCRRRSFLVHDKFSVYYHTIGLYQPWKIARGRADITLATGWYSVSVSDGRLQTAAHASAMDISAWLLQAARHCVCASPICKHRSRRSIVESFYHWAKLLSTYFKSFLPVCLDEFDRMIKRLSHGCFLISCECEWF